jgi:hypothetical protein
VGDFIGHVKVVGNLLNEAEKKFQNQKEFSLDTSKHN